VHADSWQRLADAQSFVAVAKLVCAGATAEFELSLCCVGLHEPDGRPFLVVDDQLPSRDDHRLAWVDGDLWTRDPLLEAMRAHHGPAGDGPALLLPLLEPAGLIGSIRCERPAPFTELARRDLVVLSTLVSVRLAQLGVTASGDAVKLSPRQQAVARLAARGLSNLEIADALGISDNTVKKRLKEVFRRLELSNRTELSRVLRPAPEVEVPRGISRDGGLTITRGAPRRVDAGRRR
jgi:DNA-binding CsgD family transcriptional regulator